MTDLQTFALPDRVTGMSSERELADRMIRAWRRDGIFQLEMNPMQEQHAERAFEASRRFFRMPLQLKAGCVSDLTYSGYIASGEEVTAGEADFSEIFTLCKDVPLTDARVRAQWPCHGPTPWPDDSYRQAMTAFTEVLGSVGERLLRLTALGLGLEVDALTRLTRDGWHHMRVLRFPALSPASSRGIGAHTDYGLLVIAAQDDVGGLLVRPPVEGEKRNRNWLPGESSAGMFEHQEPWTFVKPVPKVLTVFPGDILQFLTGGYLLSTPHKVRLNTRERYSMAYFHEPAFDACVRPLLGPSGDDFIHYGTHFTNMFMRCYPDRVTTRRILDEDRLATLARLRDAAMAASTPARRLAVA
ncbi:isopenicillin N synthase family oxygenase [Pyxidicoccus fallax]|uniref:2-oxoglutarate-dependent ethylene/succinate-forming enzyme n=3 Tax=Pyxidicoccus fallax TaxID=394095 RepID=A0A848L7G6_9BACT|nr:isopenicillin N synthase family oxygenase [Pyxidicoccus fallax]NMO14212.1 isopenicillin N synthase family oxygenase [Pyxidicoccus fallax]NPC80396.1 isopenicillin N synthase family oxygenase [Pyxidicoccus fallax]